MEVCSNTSKTHTHTRERTLALRWWEQVSLANANWTSPWVSKPSCFPCAEVYRYILAEQISSLLEGTSASYYTTTELLWGFTVNWPETSEPCDEGDWGRGWVASCCFLSANQYRLQIRMRRWHLQYISITRSIRLYLCLIHTGRMEIEKILHLLYSSAKHTHTYKPVAATIPILLNSPITNTIIPDTDIII